MRIAGNILYNSAFRRGRIEIDEASGQIAGLEWSDFATAQNDWSFDEGYIVPGLLDLQLNGGLGHDFTYDPTTIPTVAAALPRWGVTGFLPTIITAPLEIYRQSLEIIAEQMQHPAAGAQVLGAHFEGPYLNPQYKGAHVEKWLRQPSSVEMQALLADYPSAIRLVTLAPELPNALDLIELLIANGVIVSAGHSGANYDQAQTAFNAGVSYATHLFNAMPPLHHRNPGLIGAVLSDSRVTAGIIPDGIHLHPAIVKSIFAAKGADHLTLVTDAMAGMGMPPARYRLSGMDVIVDETSARLADGKGTLAGSIVTLDKAIKNMVEFSGCSPAQAFEMASLVPARLLKLDNCKGQLAPGFAADVAVFSPNFDVRLCLVAGKVQYQSKARI